MKILHLLAQKPGETGSGVYLKNIVKVARSKEYSQCVIAGIDINDRQYLRSMPEDVIFYPVFFNTKELPFPVPGMSDIMPYTSTKYAEMTEDMFFLWRKAFTAALNKAALFEPDLVIVHHLWLLAALSRKVFAKTPIIGICHSTEFRQLVSAGQFKEYVLNGCKQLDGIAALGSYQKDVIRRLYGIAEDKIKIVGGGFANELFYPPRKRPGQGKIKLLYAGKISRVKGVLSLLRAFTKLPIPREQVELILAGSGFGAEYDQIMDMIKGVNNVTFVGLVSQTTLSDLMRESHIFVLPSFYEGFSLVTVEALASGLRLVVNELPVLREWISTELEENGLVRFVKMPKLKGIDEPEPNELPAYEYRLREGILRQINEVKKSQTVPLLGWQEMVHNYSWEAIFSKIENIYSNLSIHKKL
jgi:glycosyltransferase involved in cell wall biosynthesis